MNVAIIGASEKPERYAYKAQIMLAEHGHEVFPVTPTGKHVLGLASYMSILDIDLDATPIQTVTLYISPPKLLPILDDLIACAPKRIIFNPGTESDEAMTRVKEAGILAIEACTLVLLTTGDFDRNT